MLTIRQLHPSPVITTAAASRPGQDEATREGCSLLVALTPAAVSPAHRIREIFWFLVQAGNIGLLVVFHSFTFDVISNIVRYSSAL